MSDDYNEGFDLGYNFDFGWSKVNAKFIKDLVSDGRYNYLKGFVYGCRTREANDKAVMSLEMQE